MTPRQITTTETATRLDPEAEAAEVRRLLNELHTFAQSSGATAGDDILRHFDFKLRHHTEYGRLGG
jgi:hypothetical protein